MDRLIIHTDDPTRPDLALTHGALFGAPERARVADIGALIPGRTGAGVRLDWVASLVGAASTPGYVTLESGDGAFAASLTRAEAEGAIVVHADGPRPFSDADGGPFRLYIPGATDRCGNVKHLARVSFSASPGADTRPPEEERSC